ncbi:MAG: efflux RND transporter periplasmic adaptor subunit [Bacteroidia bacterium]
MTKKQIIYLVIGLAIIIALAIPKLLPKAGQKGAGKPKQGPILIGKFTIQNSELDKTVSAAGTIFAEEEVELRTESSGRVLQILFKEGEAVAKGQLLLKMNDADLQAQLKKALSIEKLKIQSEKRMKQLLEKGGVSQEAYDMASTELQSAKADIDLIKEQIRKTEIRAPFAGTIGLRSISEGSTIPTNTLVARLQSLQKMKLDFSIPEKYAAFVSKGQEISFHTDAIPQDIHAKVFAIEPKIDPNNRNILIRAIFDNPGKKYFPGSFAKVQIVLKKDANAIMIPTQAVTPILKGQKVYVVSGDSVIERKIELGERMDSMVQVTKGLEAGEVIAVKGVVLLRNGAKIK